MPLNTCYVVLCRLPTAAQSLCAWLNSTWIRAAARATADPASGGYARFNARVVGGVPLPPGVLDDARFADLAVRAAGGEAIQEELDALVADCLTLGARASAGARRSGGRGRRASSLRRSIRSGIRSGAARGGPCRAARRRSPGPSRVLSPRRGRPTRRRPGWITRRPTPSGCCSPRSGRTGRRSAPIRSGTGKTYIALAVAWALGAEPSACLVPAPLVSQWQATADRLGIPAVVWSHARLSLGRLPPGSPSLVIVDESHHFRRPGIRRYRTLAPWLLGRRVLLLSATPVVNSPADLYHQLHLGLRDDVLAFDGAASLRTAFDLGQVPRALGRFVVQRMDASSGTRRPGRHRVESSSGAEVVLPDLDRLVLSTNRGIAVAGSLGAAPSRGLERRRPPRRVAPVPTPPAPRAGRLPVRPGVQIGRRLRQFTAWRGPAAAALGTHAGGGHGE